MSVRAACPSCGNRKTRSQGARAGARGATYRRRLCTRCGTSFLTREALAVRRFPWYVRRG